MQNEQKLTRTMSPIQVWAFSIGTSIGWGSLVVTCNHYLAVAGPLGSVLGMIAGGLIMLIISVNYAYLMSVFPNAGGAYTYAKETMGNDYGFLAAWFLSLTYLAILWANATSIPLFCRCFLGDTFRVLYVYTIFGYDIYLGEAFLSLAFLLCIAVLCSWNKEAAARAMTFMVLLFSIGIVICFLASFFRLGHLPEPRFVPDGKNLSQVVRIAVISPWAFIGFENISHFTEETSFRNTRYFRFLLISVIATTVLYILITLLSVTAYPPEYSSWLDYIRDRENLEGLKSLPAFYAAQHYLGGFGVTVLMLSLLSLVLTSLIGNLTSISRLFYALGRDGVLPRSFGKLNAKGLPVNAIALVIALSAFFPFLGRTAVGWIVDVTTIGATLIYGLVSASAVKLAKDRRDTKEYRFGLAGVVIMILFGIYLLVPNLYASGSMARETYFFFLVWSVLGFLYFHGLLRRDTSHQYGNSIVVWISFFSFILFISLIYLTQTVMELVQRGTSAIEQFYGSMTPSGKAPEELISELERIRQLDARSVTIIVFLIILSLVILIYNYRTISNRAQTSEAKLGLVQEIARRDPLTGVKSRHAYAEKEKELDGAILAGTADLFGIVVCDLNGLKLINDTQGHEAGDERLKQTSHVICHIFTHSPVYRNGGDEFVVFLSGQDYENRHHLMDSLKSISESHISTGEVVISAGMAEFEKGQDTRLRAVFDRADAAMYKEKKRLKGMGAPTR